MKLYEILTDFRDGHTTHVAGERVAMPDETAIKFAKRGWVLVDGVTPDPQTGGVMTLEIHNARMGISNKGL